MKFWKELEGQATVTLTAADPAGTLEKMMAAGIRLYRVEWVDDLTVRFRCSRQEKNAVRGIALKRGNAVRITGETGLMQWIRQLLARPVLVTGTAVLLALTLWLPTRVLFLRVEGNVSVPQRRILETAGECGIRFGASRQQVRSEKMKNALLGAMPELKWAGINTSGCTATISVRERSLEEEQQTSTGLGSIVACRDAYVTEVTVTRGSPMCIPGQVVQEGQVLISGMTDLGLCIQVTQAQGEVFGETNHTIRVITPSEQRVRTHQDRSRRRVSLILGKKRINLWKGSGISPATCGRMYEEYYLTLPGGFRLPVCLAVETVTYWQTQSMELPPETLEKAMLDYGRTQVLGRTVAGSILWEDAVLTKQRKTCQLDARMRCSEMIGRVTKEQIGEANGKTD